MYVKVRVPQHCASYVSVTSITITLISSTMNSKRPSFSHFIKDNNDSSYFPSICPVLAVSSGWGGERGPRNIKSMQPNLVAIFSRAVVNSIAL